CFSISRSTPLKQCRLCVPMRDALSFMLAVTETEKLLSVCAIRVPAFPRGWSNNFSSHSFQQKRKAPEWGSRFPAASLKRTTGHSREKIVTTAARVLQFACLSQKRTKKRFSSVSQK